MNAILSQSLTVNSRCATVSVVLGCVACNRSSVSCTSFWLSLSNAAVASSSTRIFGSRIIARAIAIRCFWPPDSKPPPGPTSVLYPSDRSMIKSWACAALQADMISSSLAPGFPSRIFCCTVPLKSVGSCPT
mmetsp:Transcript_34964/g.73752  ORF Transcript_34964/g.73752 Transcript_34964/m.73752 type:complete len:132 (+) Transcript_34964:188-583(+)